MVSAPDLNTEHKDGCMATPVTPCKIGGWTGSWVGSKSVEKLARGGNAWQTMADPRPLAVTVLPLA